MVGKFKRGIVGFTLLTALMAPTSLDAITIRHDKTEAEYIALSTDPRWATAGVFTSSSTCSTSGGTLIHPEWVITAAHCANANTEFRLGATRNTADISAPVAERFLNPDYSGTGDITSGDDLALMRLAAPILDVTPMRMYRLLAGEIGMTTTVIGYGRFGTGLSGDNMGGAGRRRAGQNVIDSYGSIVGASNQIAVTDFDNPR